jgi:hypothetical protein
MARPIKDTPVLKGRDAREFEKKIANPIPISKEEREEMLRIYEEIKKRCHFPV